MFCLTAQSHGAWTVKSAMHHQPMQGHAPGAVRAECLSLPVGKRCEICCKEAECRGLKRQRKSQVASRVRRTLASCSQSTAGTWAAVCMLARPCRGKCVHDFQSCPIGTFSVASLNWCCACQQLEGWTADGQAGICENRDAAAERSSICAPRRQFVSHVFPELIPD